MDWLIDWQSAIQPFTTWESAWKLPLQVIQDSYTPDTPSALTQLAVHILLGRVGFTLD